MTVPWPAFGARARWLHHLYDAGHVAAAALATGVAVAAWRRAAPRRMRGWGAVAAAAAAGAVAMGTLADDLAGAARKLGGDAAYWGLMAAAAAAIPLAAHAGRAAAARGLRAAAVALGCAAAFANHAVYPGAYPGLHLWLAWAAAALIGGALVGVPAPPVRPLRRRAAVGLAAVAALAAVTVARWPRNAVALQLARSPGSVFAPFLARIHFRDRAPARAGAGEWFADRATRPAVPPSPERLVDPRRAIVILVTIDAVRSDVFDSPRWRDHMPVLRGLRAEGVDFRVARSTGSQTVYTLATLFSGKHFSQLYWSRKGAGRTGELWPWADPTPRFPEIVQRAGIPTVTYASAWWLVGGMGVVRGFDVEPKIRSHVKTDFNFPLAEDVMAPALDRIDHHGDGPLFLYMHFMDPHWPYDRGGKRGGPKDRWVAEIDVVDREIGRLVDELRRRGLWSRTVLIVTSDHGEAFGEHRTHQHATTLYEELLRVPLIVRAPGVAPRVVAEPVSTVDLGPTVLDLFGLPTPPHFMGQSLVPLIAGRDVRLTRPIAAEGRLKQALVTRDGIKAIRDLRHGTLEAYDLRADPRELRNIIDTPRGAAAMDELRRFFDAHVYRADGYEVPYRK
ncbi:MAG: hypothetical protein D6689_03650 [Deltaproteobacteria bacterium]|nr:MAG: hypothetical protein D6689_03650 [Deltaproteobacteria bacterium]